MSFAKTMPAQTGVIFDVALGRGSRLHDAAAVAVMSWAIALCAQVAVPLPFTPVPLAGSTFGVLFAGALLGSRRGPAAVALYLLQGAGGLPFFAGGAAGWAQVLGPSGGYLVGFVAGAWVAGRLAERGWDRGAWGSLGLMLAGSAAILAVGLAGLARFVPADKLLALGLLPFLPGDLVKSFAAAALLPWGWRWLGRRGTRDIV